MKKVFNWIKRNRSKIFVILAICMIAINVLPTNDIIPNNAVFAEISRDLNGKTSQEANNDLSDAIMGFISNAGAGILGGPVAMIVNFFVLIIFIILFSVFQFMGASANGISFPFPDQIVFNRLAFFDPNFINPPTTDAGVAVVDSPVAIMQNLISNMYYSFFILAGTIFVIAAMVIGIKLAISTIASQKAQYKAALTNWVMGVVLLFTVHFLMAGMFYINEQIVQTAYHISLKSNIEFSLDLAEMIGGAAGTNMGVGMSGVGRTIGSIVSSLGKFLTGDQDWGVVTLKGYSGYLLTVVLNAASGDLVSSIIAAIILGQTVSLVVTYTKRLFYCIILGMMAPIIVAVDVIKKSMA